MRQVFEVDMRSGWCSVVLALALLLLASGCQESSSPVSRAGAGPTSARADAAGVAANVIRDYYSAINERRYEDAYRLWGSGGAASGQTLETFRDGFASTTSVEVTIGIPGPIEGAAGSRYVEIPVRIAAVAKDGLRQSFSGTYTMRRAVVDGATPEQRAWRIHSARVTRDT
jgi:hypothetical protein